MLIRSSYSYFLCYTELQNYYEFYEKVLMKTFKALIKQQIYVVELRHIFCRLLDENEQFLSLEQELIIFLRVVSLIQKECPQF